MILRQFLHDDSDCISYMFACCESGLAIVVDPIGDVQKYLRAANEARARIKFVVDTHLHDDHLSSARELSQKEHAEYALSARAAARFPHREVREGDVLALGAFNVTVLETPGHVAESIALLVGQLGDPSYILTGCALVSDPCASALNERALDLFSSMQKLKSLPDGLEILPGTRAWSAYAHSLPCSTIGFERLRNKAMRIEDEDEFVEFVHSLSVSMSGRSNAAASSCCSKSAPLGGRQ
jgi:glyoxylase-like metal-dependent hydrolase (beta-lactamase superfamily II)